MEDIKTSPKSMTTLIKEINKGIYNFDLPIQRRAGIWNKKETSLFIDSVLRNYPIYPALLNRHSDTKILDVVDFKQRFTGLADFANDKIKLSKDLKPVNIDGVDYAIAGKKFSELNELVRDRFNNRDLTLITMVDATQEEISDIFDRINMGHPLVNGQKRSTIESEETRNIIHSLASHSFFNKVTTKSQLNKNGDRDTIIQVLMFTEKDNYDFCSFRNDDMNKFILYYNDLISNDDTKEVALTKIEIIRKALNKLDEEFIEKKVKLKPTSLSLAIYGLYKVIKSKGSSSKYIEWLQNFIMDYDLNEEYKATMRQGGTASRESVQARLAYFEKAIKDM